MKPAAYKRPPRVDALTVSDQTVATTATQNSTSASPAALGVAETLALLPPDLDVVLRRVDSKYEYIDTAQGWLESEPNLNTYFELVTEVRFDKPDPDQIPLPDHLRPYQPGDIGGAVPDPGSEILLGPIGEWLTLVEPETEASLASLGAGALAALGAFLGRQVTLEVGRIQHPPNLSIVQIGYTSGGRKGTADNENRRFMGHVDPQFATLNIASGFGSGEALIERVSDPQFNKENELVSGTEDQRLLVLEGEFSKVLRTAERQGSILGDVIRLIYDGRPLANLTKSKKLVSSHHCVSLFGGITPDELIDLFPSLAASSGTGNRYLWVWSNPDKLLPRGGADITTETAAIANTIRKAPKRGMKLTFTSQAVEWWDHHYETLRMSTDVPATIESLTTRSSDHVQRIALIYAATEGSKQVDIPHLEAGLAWRNHSVATVAAVLGGLVRNQEATKILAALRTHPGIAANRRELHEVFGRNITGTAIDAAVQALQDTGLAHAWVGESASGRPPELVMATTPKNDFVRSYRPKTEKKEPETLFVPDPQNGVNRQVDTKESQYESVVVPRNGEAWDRAEDGSVAVFQVEDFMIEVTLDDASQCPSMPSMSNGVPIIYRIAGD